ncbi:hypothetical protein AM596_15800 [Clostridium perfringens CP4]|uniref:hypothetical protein n=1 Tax=Clostridium perfringens TaxID=1502 RepID=UPI0007081BB9|nr:hypothetical protein [Clostridium perfringens]KQC91220.1 hypothetical protein AM596_15800 [Clostridium perfringens CP4]
MTKLENIKLNERYTIVASDSSILGSAICQVIKCTIKDIQLVQYAQYNNALQITYRKYRGRKDSILTIVESDSICILKGLHDIESSIKTQLDEISFTSVANDPKNYFNNVNTVFFKAKHEAISTNNNDVDYDLLTDLVCDYVTDRIEAGETKEEIKDDSYYGFLKNTVIENSITLNDDLYNYLSNEGYDDLVEDLKSITFNTETVEIENQKQDLKNPESLYQFIKDTFMDAVNKLRSDNSYKAFRKFVNTYLQELNINYIRMGQHLSINGFKKIFTECKTLKEFKRVMDLIGREYGSKCVVDTYSNMLDDLKVFEEDGDQEEVEEIKQQLQTCIKLTDNLILY